MPGRHARSRSRPVGIALSIILILVGAGIFAHIRWYMHHAGAAAAKLKQGVTRETVKAVQPGGKCVAPPPSQGNGSSARMLIDIPAVSLSAPVVAGTAESQLDVAVGHLDASSWPDQGGTVVLEAHDVTFFRELDRLKQGTAIQLSAPCRSWAYTVSEHRVVAAGTPITKTSQPRLVLVTCWPTDALYLTNKRYLVVADMVTAETTTQSVKASAVPPSFVAMPPALPPGVSTDDVSPDAMGVPLGRLWVDPAMDPRWRTSDAPLQASAAALRVFGAALLALRGNHDDWWPIIGPTVSPHARAGFVGQPQWVGLVDVREVGSGTTLNSIVLQATVELRRRRYALTVTTAPVHARFMIVDWKLEAR